MSTPDPYTPSPPDGSIYTGPQEIGTGTPGNPSTTPSWLLPAAVSVACAVLLYCLGKAVK